MLDGAVTATLEHVEECDDIRGDVGSRFDDRAPHTRLRRQMDDPLRPIPAKEIAGCSLVGKVYPLGHEAR
jgi:hypothetical protein